MSWAPSYYRNKPWQISPAPRNDASLRPMAPTTQSRPGRSDYSTLIKQTRRQQTMPDDGTAHSDNGSMYALKEKLRKPKKTSMWRRIFCRRRRR
jgi:hypothetical protein